MKLPALKIPWNSIRFKLVVIVVSVLVPLFALLIYSNFYAVNVIYDQVAESNKGMLSLYMKEIDSDLQGAEGYMNRLYAYNIDLQVVNYTKDEDLRTLALYQLSNRITEDIQTYKSIDSIFIYSPDNNDFVYDFNSGSYEERRPVKDFLVDSINSDIKNKGSITNTWIVKQLGQDYYLFRIIGKGDLYLGAWLNIKKLLKPLKLINLGDKGASILVTGSGEPMASSGPVDYQQLDLDNDFADYYLTGDKEQFLVVGQKSGLGDFSLVALVQREKILENLPYLLRIVIFIAFGSMILLPVFLLLLNKTVMVPLKHIVSAMKKTGSGDMEARIEPYRTSDEFQIVNHTFNNMMSQIHDLKISVYEEHISRQKTELEYLKLQINPHFFMNTLNIIYGFAQTKNYKLIQEMTMYLVNHFRYMFGSNLVFVKLKYEVYHTRNYLHIQELRFPKRFTYEIDADESLMEYTVPPLVIQTFVENSVKYAVSMSGSIHISVLVELLDGESGQDIRVLIKDTGKGFDQKVLDDLNAGKTIKDEKGEHIGIWNIKKRLSLLYPDKAAIRLTNEDTGGAVIEILLPAKKGDSDGNQ